MKLVRDEIHPALLAAGFVFKGGNRPRDPAEQVWFDYAKGSELFTCSFKPGTGYLIAESLEESGACRTIVKTDFGNPQTRAAVIATIAIFASAVREYVAPSEPSPT